MTTKPVFAPQSQSELGSAVKACLELSAEGDCSAGPHGPIGEWDVSRVTDMSFMFAHSCWNWDWSNLVPCGSAMPNAFNLPLNFDDTKEAPPRRTVDSAR